jgi:hypothetical protein
MAEVREIADVTAQMAAKKVGASEAGVSEPTTSEAADVSVKDIQASSNFHTSCTSSSIQPEDTSLLDHLESHYLGELPKSSFNIISQTASEMAPEASASEKVISESLQQQQP